VYSPAILFSKTGKQFIALVLLSMTKCIYDNEINWQIMAKNFGALAFTAAVKQMQERLGSRAAYARMERDTYIDGLTQNETDYIAARDSFYMATFSENGYPYIQHRGGPRGFVKVIDTKRIGFIDFAGNRQYVSIGNIATNNNVSLIMIDYPARTRLKILAKAQITELEDDPALYNLLNLEDYKFRPERMIILNVEAYDWNCPQHITPRYTAEEIEEALVPQINQIKQMEKEIKRLKARLNEKGLS
jgi:predicted pyridoxine 5'-phosphate oxidase superfamily flavin-nucleotide-binding protein